MTLHIDRLLDTWYQHANKHGIVEKAMNRHCQNGHEHLADPIF